MLDRALVVVVAAMLVLFVLGSGSVQSLLHVGSSGRWLALYALWAIAVALAVLSRPERADRIPVYVVLALVLPLLGLVSSLWSVAPRVTAERAVSLGILLTAGVALAVAARSRPDVLLRTVHGLIAGAALVALGGFGLLLVDHKDAVQSASPDAPWRFRGLGANPNTFCMLAALVLPLALWVVGRGSTKLGRIGAACAAALLFAAVLVSGSRGAFVGGLGGVLMFVVASPGPRRRRLASAAAAVAVFVAGLAVMQLAKPVPLAPVARSSTPTTTSPAPAPAPHPSLTSFFPGRMTDEVGRPMNANGTTVRALFGSSGRGQAWAGALHQAGSRPLLGFGFGTEANVFEDRFYFFDGGVPENSWIGTVLQLGVIGFLLLAAFWLALGWFVVRDGAWRRAQDGSPAAGLLGAITAGFLLMVGQSYLSSVGNVATASFWLCAVLLASTVYVRKA